MPLLHLELKLPRVLTSLQPDGELPCTLIRLALASSATAAFHLASALEEQHQEQGLLVLPLPAADDHSPPTQLFAFGGLEEMPEVAVRACAADCGIEVDLVEVGSISSLNEIYLRLLGERLLARYLIAQGWCPLGAQTFGKRVDLFPGGGRDEHTFTATIDWVEAVKVVVLLDTRTTDPWGARRQLGMVVSVEPIIFKRVHPPWALLQALVARDSPQVAGAAASSGKKKEASASVTAASMGMGEGNDFRGMCNNDGVFPQSEAALELRTVKALCDPITKGVLTSLPSSTLELTSLERINARHGWDLESPRDEASMRRFWRLAHQMELPPGPLQYVRVLWKGQGAASVTYPTACLVKHFGCSYARTSLASESLCQTMIELLKAMPGVHRVFCNRTPSPVAGTGKRFTSPERPGRNLLKTARQLRDEAVLEQQAEEGRGGKEEGKEGGNKQEVFLMDQEKGARDAKRTKHTGSTTTCTPPAAKPKQLQMPLKKPAVVGTKTPPAVTPSTPAPPPLLPSAAPTRAASLTSSFPQEEKEEEDELDSLFSSSPFMPHASDVSPIKRTASPSAVAPVGQTTTLIKKTKKKTKDTITTTPEAPKKEAVEGVGETKPKKKKKAAAAGTQTTATTTTTTTMKTL